MVDPPVQLLFKFPWALYFIPIGAYVAVLGIITLAGLFQMEKRFRLLPVGQAPE
jgi:hypothetical protein